MKDDDFFDAFFERNTLAHLATVLKMLHYEANLKQMDFLVLVELHKIGEFTWGDFGTAALTSNWDKKRFYRWKDEGYIELYRKKSGASKGYNVYKLSRKSKMMVKKFYEYLSGKRPLPVKAYNKNARYTLNRTRRKIRILNEE